VAFGISLFECLTMGYIFRMKCWPLQIYVGVKKLELQQAAEHLEHEFFTIPTLLGLRFNHGDLRHEVACAWRGYAASEATWESIDVLNIDTPALLQKFRDQFADRCKARGTRVD
jgi:Chromo (CHRromatin Organisation MOdifier) domain